MASFKHMGEFCMVWKNFDQPVPTTTEGNRATNDPTNPLGKTPNSNEPLMVDCLFAWLHVKWE